MFVFLFWHDFSCPLSVRGSPPTRMQEEIPPRRTFHNRSLVNALHRHPTKDDLPHRATTAPDGASDTRRKKEHPAIPHPLHHPAAPPVPVPPAHSPALTTHRSSLARSHPLVGQA